MDLLDGVIVLLIATALFSGYRRGISWVGPSLIALVVGILVGAAVALIAGLFLWLRPSLLRGMEEVANQWVSSLRATKVLDVPHGQVDIFIARHAQRAGWLLLLGSIYLFFALFRSLA